MLLWVLGSSAGVRGRGPLNVQRELRRSSAPSSRSQPMGDVGSSAVRTTGLDLLIHDDDNDRSEVEGGLFIIVPPKE